HDQDCERCFGALDNWRIGLLVKKLTGAEVPQGIQEALESWSYVTPQIKRALMESFIRSPHPKVKAKKLTARQMEVLQLLAEGRLMKEVGTVLGLTPRTVAFHKYRIMEALGVKTNAELIQFAVKNHFVDT